MRDGDGAADVAAELVLDQVLARNNGNGVVCEPAIGDQRGIAMVLVQVAMELIGAALGHQGELAAAAGAAVCLAAGYAARKLLQGINRRSAYDGLVADAFVDTIRGAVIAHAGVHQVVHVQSVQGHVVLVNTRARHRASVCHSGLHLEERGGCISLLHRQGIERANVDVVADSGIGGVDGDLGIGGRNLDLLVYADRKCRILRTHRRHNQVNILDYKSRETLSRESGLIAGARRHFGEAIRTDRVRGLRELHARRLVGQRHRGVRHNSAGLVRHSARHACGDLPIAGRHKYQCQHRHQGTEERHYTLPTKKTHRNSSKIYL